MNNDNNKNTLTSPLSEARTETDNYINMKLAFVFNSILFPLLCTFNLAVVSFLCFISPVGVLSS